MKTIADKSGEVLDIIADLQAVESENMAYVDEEISKAQNHFAKMMLEVLRFETEKRCLLDRMIADSLIREPMNNMSPDDLKFFANQLNRNMEAEKRAISLATKAFRESELPVSRSLITYLIDDLRKENDLLKSLEDNLTDASMSATTAIETQGVSAAL